MSGQRTNYYDALMSGDERKGSSSKSRENPTINEQPKNDFRSNPRGDFRNDSRNDHPRNDFRNDSRNDHPRNDFRNDQPRSDFRNDSRNDQPRSDFRNDSRNDQPRSDFRNDSRGMHPRSDPREDFRSDFRNDSRDDFRNDSRGDRGGYRKEVNVELIREFSDLKKVRSDGRSPKMITTASLDEVESNKSDLQFKFLDNINVRNKIISECREHGYYKTTLIVDENDEFNGLMKMTDFKQLIPKWDPADYLNIYWEQKLVRRERTGEIEEYKVRKTLLLNVLKIPVDDSEIEGLTTLNIPQTNNENDALKLKRQEDKIELSQILAEKYIQWVNDIVSALDIRDITKPSAPQMYILPMLFGDGILYFNSGQGKTEYYILTTLMSIHPDVDGPQSIIIEPRAPLAHQTFIRFYEIIQHINKIRQDRFDPLKVNEYQPHTSLITIGCMMGKIREDDDINDIDNMTIIGDWIVLSMTLEDLTSLLVLTAMNSHSKKWLMIE